MTGPLPGRCLCGAVQFTATPVSDEMTVCHCAMCRRWNGGVPMATDCGSSVVFQADDKLASYRGSTWGDRLFCSVCGSSLIWQMQDGTQQHVSVHAFENSEQFRFTSQIFIDCKPANYDFANATTNLTEAEGMALMLPQEGMPDHG